MVQQSLTDATTHLRTSLIEANRALLTATGLSTANRRERPDDGPADTPTEQSTAATVEPAADLADWEVSLETEDADGITIGTTITFSKTVTDEDVRRFALATGDTNPIHLDDDAAAETRFGDRIAHGILVSGLISAALARLPGPIVYLSQDLEFHNPVFVGDDVTAECSVVEALGPAQYRLSTIVTTDGRTAIDGEAVVLVESTD